MSIGIAAFACGVLALFVSPLLLRLRGGVFAIGTWVVAETVGLIIVMQRSFGGGTGVSLRALSVYDVADRRAYTYWLTLTFAVL